MKTTQLTLWTSAAILEREVRHIKDDGRTPGMEWPSINLRVKRQLQADTDAALRNPLTPLLLRARWWTTDDYELMSAVGACHFTRDYGAWAGSARLVHWMDATRQRRMQATAERRAA